MTKDVKKNSGAYVLLVILAFLIVGANLVVKWSTYAENILQQIYIETIVIKGVLLGIFFVLVAILVKMR